MTFSDAFFLGVLRVKKLMKAKTCEILNLKQLFKPAASAYKVKLFLHGIGAPVPSGQ